LNNYFPFLIDVSYQNESLKTSGFVEATRRVASTTVIFQQPAQAEKL
jgi:hypothetical protein